MAVSVVPDAGVRLSDDVASFYSAVAPHVDKMRRVAARLAGVDNRDDVVQDALLQAWRARGQFDPSKGTLSAWLLAITAHQASKVRRRIRLFFSTAKHAEVGLDDAIDVRAAITRLTRRERLAVDCFYFADLSIAETAGVMGCSEGTVKSTLSSARERLRGLLR
jgi:RNA polymerase sigma-70 factor (ECF subfamily)